MSHSSRKPKNTLHACSNMLQLAGTDSELAEQSGPVSWATGQSTSLLVGGWAGQCLSDKESAGATPPPSETCPVGSGPQQQVCWGGKGGGGWGERGGRGNKGGGKKERLCSQVYCVAANAHVHACTHADILVYMTHTSLHEPMHVPHMGCAMAIIHNTLSPVMRGGLRYLTAPLIPEQGAANLGEGLNDASFDPTTAASESSGRLSMYSRSLMPSTL